ncbi:hypothetical protein [Kribbella sp. CA-293567]|uniref:hypothetical protein n=1 Tax=Kribbella sp. CA-293567 TaxID=3002436 RepID=UPI0022DD1C94|nr:hypothetical protein [Kribbella sp. CA-293567]WBQ02198.1 hypothetical protein OX958_19635 [Kribbella sp. CA-293567]
MLTTAASVRFTVWTNAMLTGACDPDTAAAKILGADVGHQVSGLAGHPLPTTLPVALNLLRAAGATQAHLALPIPGDPIGLAGPPKFNEAALESGEAVVLTGVDLGLVPAYVGPAVQWTVLPATGPPPADIGEADRGLRAALIEAAESLAALDVAKWKPEVADALIDIRRIGLGQGDDLAPGYEARAVKTAATARRCLAIADAALDDDGAAVTGAEADARRRALTDLAAAARRALVAACGPPVLR